MTRLTRLILRLFFLLFGIAFLAVALLAVRLSAGPMDVSFLAGYLEDAMADAPVTLSIERTQLAWDGFGTPIELIAVDTRLSDSITGEPLADLPGMALSLSVTDLLEGTLVPRQLRLIEPELHVIRDEDGSFRFNLGEPGPAQFAAPETGIGALDQVSVTAFENLLLGLLAPPETVGGMTSLESLIIENGVVTVDDRRLGQVWRAPDAFIEVRREPGGVHATADLTAAVEDTRLDLVLDLRMREEGDAVAIFGRVEAEGQIGQQVGRYRGSVDYRIGRDEAASSIELVGEVSIAASPDSPFFAANIIVDHAFDEALTNVRFSLDDLVPAELADFDEVLEPLRTVRSPVIASGWLRLGSGLSLEVLEIHMRAGSGTLVLPWIYDEPVTVGSVSLSANANFPANRFNLTDYRIDLGGPRIEGEGTIEVTEDGQLDVVGLAGVSGMPLDLLHRYWPETFQPARDWVLSNLSRGVIDRSDVTFQARVAIDGTESEVVAVDGQIHARDVTVRYLPEMTPISDAEVTATFDRARWHILVEGGRIGDLSVTQGDVYLRGLDSAAPDTLEVDVGLGGRAEELVDELREPPVSLGELSTLALGTITGRASGRLRLVLDLGAAAADLSFGAALRFSDLNLADLPGDRRLSGFDGTMDVDGRRLIVEGEGLIDGFPATIAHSQDFYVGAGEAGGRTRIQMADLPPEAWARLGFPPLPIGDVPVGLQATIDGFADGSAEVAAEIDVSAAELVVAPLGYRKTPGEAATLDADFALDPTGRTERIDLSLAAPSLQTAGYLTVNEEGDADRLVLDNVAIGSSQFTLDVEFGTEGPRAMTIGGSTLDVRPTVGPLLQDMESLVSADASDVPDTAPPDGSGQRLDVTLDVDRLLLSERLSILNALGEMTLFGGQVAALSVLGSDEGGSHLAFEYRPEGTGQWIGVDSGDAGRLLRALDLTDSVTGGTLQLAASAGRTGAVWTGGIDLRDFSVSDVPAITRFIAGQSGGTGNSVLFSRAEGAFDLVGSQLRIETLRAAGGELGLSMSGVIDLATDRVDLSGTIVPVRSVNELVAGIPLIGDILAAGQGVLAFTMQITGSLDSPNVSVNPLSVLAPGIIREIFFQGGTG